MSMKNIINKIKNILSLIDLKYEHIFNQILKISTIDELLRKIKVPVDKILQERKINKLVRYLIVCICIGFLYIYFSSGEKNYQGEILKSYVVLPEKIKEKIDSLGLISTNIEIKKIKTPKLSKDMVDNGIRSYGLIESTIIKFIEANLDKLIDWDKSLENAIEVQFVKIFAEIFEKYGNVCNLISKEKIFELYKKDLPVSKGDFIEEILNGKNYNVINTLESKGCVKIDLSKNSKYNEWESKIKDEIMTMINEKIKEETSKKAFDLAFDLVSRAMNQDVLSWFKCNFSPESKNFHILFPNYVNLKSLNSFIYEKIQYEFEMNRRFKIGEDMETSFFKNLDKISPEKSSKLKAIIDNNELGFDEFNKKVQLLDIPRDIIMRVKSIPNLVSFFRDNRITDAELTKLSPVIDDLMSNLETKNNFINTFFNAFNSNPTVNGVTSRVFLLQSNPHFKDISKIDLDNIIRNAILSYYEKDLKEILTKKYLKVFFLTNLKISQMQKGIPEKISFEEFMESEFKDKFSVEILKKINVDPAKISEKTKKTILKDDIYGQILPFDFLKKPINFWECIERNRIRQVDFDFEVDNENQDDKIIISNNLITQSRTIHFFNLLKEEIYLQKEAERIRKENEKNALAKAIAEKERIISELFQTDGLEVLKQILSFTSNIKGDITIKINSVQKQKSSDSIEMTFLVEDFAPEIKSKKIIYWNAIDLMKESSDNVRRGKIYDRMKFSLKVPNQDYKVNLDISYAGDIIYSGSITCSVMQNKYLSLYAMDIKDRNGNSIMFPVEKRQEIRFGRLSRVSSESPYSYSIFEKTEYFKKLKAIFVADVKKQFRELLNQKRVVEFPENININEIDEKCVSNIFNLILQDEVLRAYIEANPTIKPSDGLGAIAILATDGSTFSPKKFIEELHFDRKFKTPLLNNNKLMELYMEISKIKNKSRLFKQVFDNERVRNKYLWTSDQKKVHNDISDSIISSFDTSDVESWAILSTISAITLNSISFNKLKVEDLKKEIDISGIIKQRVIYDSIKNLEKEVIFIEFDENTPQVVKDLFACIQINPSNSPFKYYESKIDCTFKATFQIVTVNNIILPRFMLK